mmetsp:Transcript_5840/g.15212  ORF Transcript_5840/g.15212 Transcript_5840/m.15212 type:complete len:272 (+) Transcript_5840:1742-2557(+)
MMRLWGGIFTTTWRKRVRPLRSDFCTSSDHPSKSCGNAQTQSVLTGVVSLSAAAGLGTAKLFLAERGWIDGAPIQFGIWCNILTCMIQWRSSSQCRSCPGSFTIASPSVAPGENSTPFYIIFTPRHATSGYASPPGAVLHATHLLRPDFAIATIQLPSCWAPGDWASGFKLRCAQVGHRAAVPHAMSLAGDHFLQTRSCAEDQLTTVASDDNVDSGDMVVRVKRFNFQVCGWDACSSHRLTMLKGRGKRKCISQVSHTGDGQFCCIIPGDF